MLVSKFWEILEHQRNQISGWVFYRSSWKVARKISNGLINTSTNLYNIRIATSVDRVQKDKISDLSALFDSFRQFPKVVCSSSKIIIFSISTHFILIDDIFVINLVKFGFRLLLASHQLCCWLGLPFCRHFNSQSSCRKVKKFSISLFWTFLLPGLSSKFTVLEDFASLAKIWELIIVYTKRRSTTRKVTNKYNGNPNGQIWPGGGTYR